MNNEENLQQQILKLKREKRYLEDKVMLVEDSNVFRFGMILKSSINWPWLLPLLPLRLVIFVLDLLRQYFLLYIITPFRKVWFTSHPPKDVAFLCYSGQTGGGERVALGHLKKASQHYTADAYYITKPGDISKEARKYARRVIFNVRPEYQLAGYKALYITLCMPNISIIKEINPDIKIAMVLHDHLSGWIDYFQGYSHTPLIDKFICISNLVRDELLKNIPDLDPAKVEVLYNPNFFGNNDVGKVKEENKNEKDEFVFGYVGRISPEKNPISAVRVFKKFISKHPNVKFKIVGGIDEKLEHLRVYRDLLQEEIGDNKNIEYLGYSNKTSEFIETLDGVVLSSFMEGISVAATEALSFGVPVVSSDVGAMSEVIKSGNNGFLYNIDDLDINPFDIREDFRFFSEDDENRFLETLEKFMKTQWDRKAIAKEAIRKFSEEVAYENFINMFNKLVDA